MANHFSLVIQAGPNPGQRTPLSKENLLIGRDPASDLHIQDIEVSRRHARLIAQSSGFVLEDLGSTNGTFVNGQRVRTVTVLRPGDEIRLGEIITLRYELDLNSLETTPPSISASRPSAARRSTVPPPPTASLPPLEERPAAPASQAPLPPPSRPDEPLAVRMAAARNFVDPLQYDAAADMPAEEAPQAASARRQRRRGPRFSNNVILGCLAVLLLGACATTAFLWYVDANFLWCDVFGSLIPACVSP